MIKVLCTGDIHIGRMPSKVPIDIAAPYSCAQMFTKLIDLAIKRNVDVMAFTGDLVNSSDNVIAACHAIETGINRLIQNNIHCVMVAGNHDNDVLPRVVQHITDARFKLLGKNGRWEAYSVERNGETVTFHGWSFSDTYEKGCPLDTYNLERANTGTTVGLLHCDLDVVPSKYAGTLLGDFDKCKVDVWLLGHIHAPKITPTPKGIKVLYPGSPQGMDPGETGAHGPWMIELDPHNVCMTHIPMAPVVYHTELNVSTCELKSAYELERLLANAARSAHAKYCAGCDVAPEVISLRLCLTGQCPISEQLTALFNELGEYVTVVEETTVRLDKVDFSGVRPTIDLETLKDNHDLIGQTAQTILEMEAGCGPQALFDRALKEMQDQCNGPAFRPIATDEFVDAEAVRKRLIGQGYRLLEALLAQKAPATGGNN